MLKKKNISRTKKSKKKFSLSYKLSFTILIPIISLFSLSLICFFQIKNLTEKSSMLAKVNIPSIDQAYKLRSLVSEFRLEEFRHVLEQKKELKKLAENNLIK